MKNLDAGGVCLCAIPVAAGIPTNDLSLGTRCHIFMTGAEGIDLKFPSCQEDSKPLWTTVHAKTGLALTINCLGHCMKSGDCRKMPALTSYSHKIIHQVLTILNNGCV